MPVRKLDTFLKVNNGLQEGEARDNNLRSKLKVADFLLVHCSRPSCMRVSLSTGSGTGVHFIGI